MPELGEKGSSAFLAYGQWLLELHNDRAAGFTQRTVGVLGFAGVILALAPIALKLPNDVQVNAGLVITASVMFGALLLCVAFCLSVLAPQKVILPAVSHSREAWRMYLTEKRTGKANRDLAEALFRGSTLTQPSPLDLALHDASVRGTRFRWSVWCLAISIGALAATVAQLSWQMVR